MVSKETIYIHYGSLSFNSKKYEEVQNSTFSSKPVNGGFWASPDSSERGWGSINKLRPQDCHYFKFRLSDTAKVLMIDNKESLNNLPKIKSEVEKFPIILDFEKLSMKYDAIIYKYSEEMDRILPCWDCDCILIMNPKVIKDLR